MNNEELKKKIAQIIADYFCPQKNEHKNLWGDDRMCYSKMNFAECERVAECTDALIAEVVRDIVKIAREIGVSATAMAVFEAEEAKHRAEVAEKAGRIIQRDMTSVFDISNPRVCELIANIWDLAKKQAEKELQEEKNG